MLITLLAQVVKQQALVFFQQLPENNPLHASQNFISKQSATAVCFISHGGQWYYQLILIHFFYLKLHYACRLRAIEVFIVKIHGLFSSNDDSCEEQQRCASSWGVA